jgi:hypothetical protein
MGATMAAKTEKSVRGFLRALAVFACLLLPGVSHAYTAVASLQGHSVSTMYAGWNFSTQKTADAAALDGCRKTAKANGLAKLASKCEVIHRQKGPGAGAMVCGKIGCTIRTGYDTEQDAVDEAYQQCEQQGYGDCRKTDITNWWDDTGYPKLAVKDVQPANTCGPPPGRTVRSTTQCNNGDCTRTFENGCTVKFQAPYCHDPFSGKWEWKPDGC